MYKAVVMAGGLGTRMRPTLAGGINKHLYPVAGKPLIHFPLELLARSGVRDVLLLLNGVHPELIMETIEDGSAFGLNVVYAYTTETYGASVGRHLVMAERWVGQEPFLLMLGDSIYFLDTIPNLSDSSATHSWVMPRPTSNWDDVGKYATCLQDGQYIQTGLWLFDARVLVAARQLADRSELRIRHLVQRLHEEAPVSTSKLPAESFIDCGTPDAIKRAETRLET